MGLGDAPTDPDEDLRAGTVECRKTRHRRGRKFWRKGYEGDKKARRSNILQHLRKIFINILDYTHISLVSERFDVYTHCG